MLDGLLNVLNGLTDIEFVEEAWSHAPDKKYGVITLDGQKALKTGRSMISEKMLRGYVDVFEKKPKNLNTPNSVEAALSRLGIYFNLESVQFENETGYVHWEWRWVDTLNVCSQKIYVVKFVTSEGETSQLVRLGRMPAVPTVEPYVLDGLKYDFSRWDQEVAAASQNVVYTAQYYIEIQIMLGSDGVYYARNFIGSPNMRLTSDQIDTVISWFDGGDIVGCVWNGATFQATEVTDEHVKLPGITAIWA